MTIAVRLAIYSYFSLYSVQQVFAIGGLSDLETIYNYRLIWRLFDVVVKFLPNCICIPGEVRLQAVRCELVRRGLSLSNFYNADGIIKYSKLNLELVLLETSGPFNKCSSNKKNTDHIKAAYGLLAMLNSIAYKYCYADVDLFKKLKVYFVHAAGDKVRLWSLNLATAKIYVLNRQRSSQVPVQSYGCKENVMAIVNMMWELKVFITDFDKIPFYAYLLFIIGWSC